MDLTTIYEAVGIVGTVVSVGGAVWSRRAAKLSEPTGNGFAKKVLAFVDRQDARNILVDERFDRLETRLDGLEQR